MRRARRRASELTCDAATTAGHSAVAPAAKGSTTCSGCITLAGLRQRRHLVIPLVLQRVRACRRQLDSSVARDSRYRGIAFASSGLDGRSAERERKPFVRQNVTIPQIYATYACGESNKVSSGIHSNRKVMISMPFPGSFSLLFQVLKAK